jgi:BolA family transcriptional regulator, general stress-responsive regulator
MRVAEEIKSRLEQRFAPRELGPLGRIARHRAIHSALGADLVGRIHALAIDADG